MKVKFSMHQFYKKYLLRGNQLLPLLRRRSFEQRKRFRMPTGAGAARHAAAAVAIRLRLLRRQRAEHIFAVGVGVRVGRLALLAAAAARRTNNFDAFLRRISFVAIRVDFLPLFLRVVQPNARIIMRSEQNVNLLSV